jgi:hypothetical protein
MTTSSHISAIYTVIREGSRMGTSGLSTLGTVK